MKKEDINNIKIPGYTCASAFCRKKSIKVVVCFLSIIIYPSKCLMFQNFVFERKCEIVAITINVLTTQVYIIEVYRPPSK